MTTFPDCEPDMIDSPGAARIRVDQMLVERGFYPSRSRARDGLLRGAVRVAGQAIGKAGALVAADAQVDIDDAALSYVSRAALKLIAGLDRFGFDPVGRQTLDIGASTGGFSQVLLERGAAHVIAVDVGQGQLHPLLSADCRVSNRPGLNARDLTAADLEGRLIGAVVSDVSFISLRLALPRALSLAAPGAFAVLLVKPQFEVGRAAIGKGGIVRDPALSLSVARDLADWLGNQPGWSAAGLIPSPIEGGDGNREFLIGGIRS